MTVIYIMMNDKPGKIEEFFQITKEKPPSPLLEEAIIILNIKGWALDLGCGAGRDTKFLLDKGFRVTALDISPQVSEYLKDFPHQENLDLIISSFEDFNFEKEKYDLVNAQLSLPFTNRDEFDEVFSKMKDSIKRGGIFVGQLFGVNDDWNKSKTTKMTFHTKEEAQVLFNNMELLKFIEKDYDGTIANGTPKHWHVFHIIAQKK